MDNKDEYLLCRKFHKGTCNTCIFDDPKLKTYCLIVYINIVCYELNIFNVGFDKETIEEIYSIYNKEK